MSAFSSSILFLSRAALDSPVVVEGWVTVVVGAAVVVTVVVVVGATVVVVVVVEG